MLNQPTIHFKRIVLPGEVRRGRRISKWPARAGERDRQPTIPIRYIMLTNTYPQTVHCLDQVFRTHLPAASSDKTGISVTIETVLQPHRLIISANNILPARKSAD